jgi:hypothetical protein
MAIAIHLHRTNKHQNPYDWRFFEAWRVLRTTTSKFCRPQAGPVGGHNYDWNIVNDENVANANNHNENSNEILLENEALELPGV